MPHDRTDGAFAMTRDGAMSRDVHVWQARLDLETSSVEALWHTLTAQESARACAFRFPELRRRYVVARGVLRAILARYLGADPRAIPIRTQSFGKPELATTGPHHRLRFNLSHSGDLALYGFAVGRDVGIDVERLSPPRASMAIAERFLSPSETNALRSLEADRRHRAFLACWTRKEAYVKAKGLGLAAQLDRFSVSVDPDCAAVRLETADGQETSEWSIDALDAGAGFVAAVCVQGTRARIVRRSWPSQRPAPARRVTKVSGFT
jgi:4'-phosphopantetheinyl transferase